MDSGVGGAGSSYCCNLLALWEGETQCFSPEPQPPSSAGWNGCRGDCLRLLPALTSPVFHCLLERASEQMTLHLPDTCPHKCYSPKYQEEGERQEKGDERQGVSHGIDLPQDEQQIPVILLDREEGQT